MSVRSGGGLEASQPLWPRASVVDILAPRRFGAAINSSALVAFRWVLIALGTALAARSPDGGRAIELGAALVFVASVRSIQLHRPGPGWLCALFPGLCVEIAIVAAMVALSGGSRSPWILALVAEMALLGALVPSRWAGSMAAVGLIGLLVTSVVLRSQPLVHGWPASVGLLGVIALTVAYASWVFARAERHRALLAEVNERLASTNALLVGLDRASPRDGEAFDPRRCARSIAATARLVLEAETIVVLAVTALPGRWQVLHAEGVDLAAVVDDSEIPFLRGLAEGDGGEAICGPTRTAFGPADTSLVAGSSSGIRIPLHMHDRLVGVLLLEDPKAERWAATDGSVIAQLAERAALMLDNARRFNALWVVGATEERTRVAHDLHDHLGQNMAALGLELDVLARRTEDPVVKAKVRELRARVTFMVSDLRGTMRDLRCDVSETRDLTNALGGLVRDFDSRGDATVNFESDGGGRLSLAQEHQLLLVARQALTTAVVDAGASMVKVRWTCDGESGILQVDHDGGIADLAEMGSLPAAAHIDALIGIEDRCRAIGARFHSDVAGSISCEVAG